MELTKSQKTNRKVHAACVCRCIFLPKVVVLNDLVITLKRYVAGTIALNLDRRHILIEPDATSKMQWQIQDFP